MNKGFITLQRSFFNHPFWEKKRDFSRAEAFLDLIQNASFVDREVEIKGGIIPIKRGEQVASLRFLATRWSWSPSKVNRFISVLKAEQMVAHQTRQGESIITLCKYDTYNPSQDSNETPNETPNETETKHQRDSDETKVIKVISEEGKKNKARGTADEFAEYAKSIDLPASDGEYLHSHLEANGWVNGKNPVRCWRSQMRAWKSGGFLPSLRNQNKKQNSGIRAGQFKIS